MIQETDQRKASGPEGGWVQTLYLTSKPFVKITTKGGREEKKKHNNQRVWTPTETLNLQSVGCF